MGLLGGEDHICGQKPTIQCVTILGSCKIHSISSLDHVNSELFLMWELSCFYPTCVDEGKKRIVTILNMPCLGRPSHWYV